VKDLNSSLAQRYRLKETKGVVVVQVDQGSPAMEAGLRPGDLILEVNGKAVEKVKDYQEIMGKLKSGGLARLQVKSRTHTGYLVLEIP
jgi:serine protease Do